MHCALRARLVLVPSLVLVAACGGATPQPSVGTAPVVAPAPVASPPLPVPPAAPEPTHVVLDNETLRLEGTPAVPAELRARLSQYLDVRRAALAAVNDDGTQLLITTRFAETTQIHLVRSPLGVRTQLTFLGEPAGNGRFVPGDRNAFLYTADIGGNEQYQIFRRDMTTGRTLRLTDADSRQDAPRWSRDGQWIAYSSNQRNKRDFDIWLADGRDPASAQRIVDGNGQWNVVDWSPDGKKLLVGEFISANESHLYVTDIASKTTTRISPEGTATYELALFGNDGKTIYVASDREGEFAELYETDLTGANWRPLTRAMHWDVESIALSPDGRTLAFVLNQGGISALHLLDTRTRRSRPAAGIPRGWITDLQFARKAPVLAFTFSSATQPGDAYTYDLRKNKLVRFTESELGGLSSQTLIEPTLIEYDSFDGVKIPALYYKPRKPGPVPVIIAIHGGPESQARPSFSSFTQYALVESGIAVIYPNVRGSSGYGKTYLAMDNGKKREDSVKDIGALLDWIARNPDLDAGRVGVLGGSYGGYMVLASLMHYGERIVAGVEIVGISNFVTFLENTQAYRRDLRRAEYGDERDSDMRTFLDSISPTKNVASLKSALFVAQGANDPRVPASESQQIVAAVRQAGHDIWYMLAKNEGHGFRKKENQDIYTQLTILFFEKQLRKGS